MCSTMPLDLTLLGRGVVGFSTALVGFLLVCTLQAPLSSIPVI